MTINIKNTIKDTHITIRDANGEQIMEILLDRVALKQRDMATAEVGSLTSAEEAAMKLVDKYPFVLDQSEVELDLKGFGPGRLDGLTTALGPLGDEIRNRLTKRVGKTR